MTNSPPKISAIGLIKLMGSKDAPMLFDVRKKPAFNESDGMLPGATWQDYETIASTIDLPLGALIIVYCVHGHEVSQTAASLLHEKGLNVRFLEGGYESYLEAGGMIVQKETSGTSNKAS